MFTNMFRSRPLPGLPKFISILQLVLSLSEGIKKLIALRRERPEMEEGSEYRQSSPEE